MILDWIIETYKCVVYHTLKEILSLNEIELVKQNGLMHFTNYENTIFIVENGVDADSGKEMLKREKGYSWFYIYEQSTFKEKLRIVHSKGNRKSYDAYIIIKDISDAQIEKLRIRRKHDNAVNYQGKSYTNNIVAKNIN